MSNDPHMAGRPRKHPSQPAVTRFEECSLALFAALAIGTITLPVRAQSVDPSPVEAVRTAGAVAGPATSLAHPVSQSVRAAFVRADTNGDGRLSREESARLPVVHERFEQMDLDGDRFLSRDEFYKGVVD